MESYQKRKRLEEEYGKPIQVNLFNDELKGNKNQNVF